MKHRLTHTPSRRIRRSPLQVETLETRLPLTASFAFLFSAESSFTAPAGSSLSIPVVAQIKSELDAADEGAQGWSMSIRNETPSRFSIVEAEALVPTDVGFLENEFTTGVDNEGVIHSEVISFLQPVTLEEGVVDVFRLTLEGTVPAAGVTETWTLAFVDGLEGTGIPTDNLVTSQGQAAFPSLDSISLSVTGEAPALSIKIADVKVNEGDEGTSNAIFAVSLSRPHDEPVYMDYVTRNETAVAGVDFVNTHGSLVFQPGQTTRWIVVPILGDRSREADETFVVQIGNASTGEIVDDQARGAIIDADELLLGDATNDFVVDLEDFNILKRNFGGRGGFADGDFNGDGRIDLEDFNILKRNFGAGGKKPRS